MSRTLDDLRTTLQMYGAELPISSAPTLGVHKRIRRLRRQRVVAGVAAAALVAGAASVVVHSSRDTSTAGSTGKAPIYYAGGRLVAQLDIDTRVSASVSTTITPTTTTLTLYSVSCVPGGTGDIGIDYMVGDRDGFGETCGDSVVVPVTPGTPTLITFQLVHTNTARPASVTDSERPHLPTIRAVGGVYAPVPRAEYQFPTAPRTLQSMNQFGPASQDLTRGSGNLTTSGAVHLQDGLQVVVMTVAPGVVTLRIGGKQVHQVQSWDYALQQFRVNLTPAGLAALGIREVTATLTVTTSDFPSYPGTALWRVTARP